MFSLIQMITGKKPRYRVKALGKYYPPCNKKNDNLAEMSLKRFSELNPSYRSYLIGELRG